MNISEKEKLDIIYYAGEIEYRLLEGFRPNSTTWCFACIYRA